MKHVYVIMLFYTFTVFQLKHLVDVVVKRIGLDCGDRFKANSKKVKFYISGPLPLDTCFPKFTDFEVAHHYLQQVRCDTLNHCFPKFTALSCKTLRFWVLSTILFDIALRTRSTFKSTEVIILILFYRLIPMRRVEVRADCENGVEMVVGLILAPYEGQNVKVKP